MLLPEEHYCLVMTKCLLMNNASWNLWPLLLFTCCLIWLHAMSRERTCLQWDTVSESRTEADNSVDAPNISHVEFRAATARRVASFPKSFCVRSCSTQTFQRSSFLIKSCQIRSEEAFLISCLFSPVAPSHYVYKVKNKVWVQWLL